MKKPMKSLYPTTKVLDARVPKPVNLSGWRFFGFCSLLVGTFCLTLYPVVIDPILSPDKYREAHKQIQTELFQAGLLPGQLKKWEDPWEKAWEKGKKSNPSSDIK